MYVRLCGFQVIEMSSGFIHNMVYCLLELEMMLIERPKYASTAFMNVCLTLILFFKFFPYGHCFSWENEPFYVCFQVLHVQKIVLECARMA